MVWVYHYTVFISAVKESEINQKKPETRGQTGLNQVSTAVK